MNTKLIEEAYERLNGVVNKTPLELNKRLSEKYKARVYLKREDLQVVRSYKVRGAYNRMSTLSLKEKERGVVCASAGNHAQGVALSCEKLKVKGCIYMPKNTPKQKVERVKVLGKKWVIIHLIGDTFDEACMHAKSFCDKNNKTFVHPFDDEYVIAGQGTVGAEIFEQLKGYIDYIVVPVGGGGLLSGLGFYAKSKNKNIKLVGVEPCGAPSMSKSLEAKRVVTLKSVDKFVDGAAVKTVGKLNYKLSKNLLDNMLVVPEGMVCQEMVSLYQSDGIISEPAGALSVAALEMLKVEIKGKTVVCVVSGGIMTLVGTLRL